MLWQFGAWDRVVGVSVFCDVPTEANDLPKIGSGMDPDIERILALAPDLVVGSIIQEDYPFVRILRDAGVDVMLVQDQGLEDVLSDMPRFAGRLGPSEFEIAEQLVDGVRRELDALRLAIPDSPPPRVLIVYDHDPIYVAGPDTFINQLLTAAGGLNVVRSGDWVQLDREAVVQLAPEFVFQPGIGTHEDLRRAWADMRVVPAVREGRIYSLESPAIARPGVGVADAAQEMSRLLWGRSDSP